MNNLFQTYTFNNGVEVKNRLVVAPMTHWASDEEGHITDVERSFLKDRAQNFGMFITAATLVSPEGKAFAGEPFAVDSNDLPSLKEVAEIIHAQGAKAVLQIHHGGKLAPNDLLNGKNKVAPSRDQETGAREMTVSEIEATIQAYGRATELAIEAGFDGVEIHGANGYLIQQFFSGHSNRREDEWGGLIEQRLKFPLAVVDAVLAAKERSGRNDFIVGYRFSPEEPEEKGITMADTFVLIDALVGKALQYLHVSLHDFFSHARRGADSARLRIDLLHEHINGRLPLIGVGNLLSAEQIQRAFDTGSVEFVALGKAVLLNPSIVSLLQNGEFDKIETELDPEQKEKYHFSDILWHLNMQNMSFLPPVKGVVK